MLETIPNVLILNDAFRQLDVELRVQTAIEMRQVARFYIKREVHKH